MSESILTSVKKLLGMTEEYTPFDLDIVTHINSVFMILNQMGIGPEETYKITGKEETWDEFIEDNKIEAVKSYMAAKVKMIFDPPSSSIVAEANKSIIAELEWRLNVICDTEEE